MSIFQPGQDFIREWASKLTPEEARLVVAQVVQYLYESQDVRLGDIAPFWEASEQPLVPGQRIWKDSFKP